MGSVGISVKVWKLGWDIGLREFVTSDSSVFVFQDRSTEELAYVQTMVRQLAGDASLEGVLVDTLELVSGGKGEVGTKGEPEGEVTEPLVKLELDEDLEDEDTKDNIEFDDNDNDWDDEDDEDEGSKEDQEVETCNGCGKTYTKRFHLRKHLEVCNPDQIARLPARYTNRQKKTSDSRRGPRSEEALARRMGTLAKTAEVCAKCGESYKHRSFLIDHLKCCNPEQIPELEQQEMIKKAAMKILDKGDDSLRCRFCPRQFSFKKSLEKHENLHESDPESPKLKEKKTNGKTAGRKGNFQCDKCSSSFKIYTALERHMEAHMLAATERSKLQDEQTDLGLGLKTNELRDGALMRCVPCDLVYTKIGMYQQHMDNYHPKGFSCEECGKKFTLPNSLNTHRLNYHTSFPKNCDDCGQNCGTKKEYEEHLKEVHGQGGPANQVPCEICGKLVKNKHTLKSHVKLVHGKGGSEFPCDKCGKIFKSKGSLKYHSMVHTGEYKFRCEECGHGYMNFQQMQNCKNTHAGIFKYTCPHCEYKTNKSQGLANHITTHSAAKPWICPICQHTSSTTSNLNSHIKKVHKMTLCQAEAVTKRNRYGRDMNEDEMDQNLVLLQRGASSLETKELYTDSQQQAITMKILESRRKMRDIRQEAGAGAGQEERLEESPHPPTGFPLDLGPRPPLFLQGAHKYF